MFTITNTSLKYDKPTVQEDKIAYYLVTFTASYDGGTQFTGSTKVFASQFETMNLKDIKNLVMHRIADTLSKEN